jgi:ABC-type sugar transport system permease subunit
MSRTRWAATLLAPAVLLLGTFQIYPVIYAVYISFHKYDLMSPPVYVGSANYVRLLSDQQFLRSIWITAFYVFWTIVPVICLSFLLAFMLSRLGRSSGFWRLLIYLPSILPFVSVALVWKLMFNQRGPINDILVKMGEAPIPWLTNGYFAPWALIGMSWWHATSYYTIIFLAGFLSLPRDPFEAATVDGATGWQIMRHITIPLMRPTIALVVVLATVNGLKTFVFHQVLTDGGPANATQILTILIYKTAFSYLELGRASAYSIVLFSLIMALSLIQIWLLSEKKDA